MQSTSLLADSVIHLYVAKIDYILVLHPTINQSCLKRARIMRRKEIAALTILFSFVRSFILCTENASKKDQYLRSPYRLGSASCPCHRCSLRDLLKSTLPSSILLICEAAATGFILPTPLCRLFR